MTISFLDFIHKNEPRIRQVADELQHFTINAKKIRIRAAKKRIIEWLENFDKIGYNNFELALHLIEHLDFIESHEISDKIINEADSWINSKFAYIAPLGEPNESSFLLTSRLFRMDRFFKSLSDLLNCISINRHSKILLFDDFLNSGGQIVSIFYALLNKQLPNGEINDEAESRTVLTPEQVKKLKSCEIHLFYYQAFEEGIGKVQSQLKIELNLNIHIHSHFFTNKNDCAFGDLFEQEKIEEGASGKLKHKSLFQGKTYVELKDFYLILKNVGESLLRNNEPKWEETKFINRALGYGNLSRVIITDYNVPTITITALWQRGTFKYNGKSFFWKELVPRTKKVIPPKIKFTKLDNEENILAKTIAELQSLYITDEIEKGLELADKAYLKFGEHPKIIKHFFRFNMRVKNWEKIRTSIETLEINNLSEEIITLCNLTLLECEVREGMSVYKKDRTEFSKKILNSKKFLDNIPESFHNYGEYLYWLGRWYLELWYSSQGLDITNLKHALHCFDKAILQRYKWWYHCYKCIVLKLLKSDLYANEVNLFVKTIEQVRLLEPLRPSLRTYSISAYLLKDDLNMINQLLEEFNIPSSVTDFQATIINHLEYIFYYDKNKQRKYRAILESWIANLPVK